jgi:hypothetical protein
MKMKTYFSFLQEDERQELPEVNDIDHEEIFGDTESELIEPTPSVSNTDRTDRMDGTDRIGMPRGSRAVSAAKKMKLFLEARQRNEVRFREEEHDLRMQVLNLFCC